MINRRHNGRASCLARQSLGQTLEGKPQIHSPASGKGGHESGLNKIGAAKSAQFLRMTFATMDTPRENRGCG
jgi:hypothetical protein